MTCRINQQSERNDDLSLELLGRDDNELLGLELALQESNKAAVNDRGLAPEVEVKGGD